MNSNAVRTMVESVLADRAETSARLEKLDHLLANLNELYPGAYTHAYTDPEDAAGALGTSEPRENVKLTPGPERLERDAHSLDTKGAVAQVLSANMSRWLSAVEVAELALAAGWQAGEDSPDHVAVIRTRLSRMGDTLEFRARDGRTKEYRLSARHTDTEAPVSAGASDSERPSDDLSWKEGDSDNGSETPDGRDSNQGDTWHDHDHGFRASVNGGSDT